MPIGIKKLKQITVYNQQKDGHRAKDGASETCGLHVLKNALIYFDNLSDPKTQAQKLKDPNLFKDFYQNVSKYLPKQQGGHDITVATQRDLVEKLYEGKLKGLFKDHLLELQKDQAGLPMISAGEAFSGRNFAAIGSTDNLAVLANLYEISKFPNDRPFYHSFLYGIDGIHWICLILHQNEKGEREWIGMDSYNNQSIHFDEATRSLNTMLDLNYLNHNLKGIYNECVHTLDYLYRRAFKGDALLQDPVNKFPNGKEWLLDPRSLEQRIQNLKDAYHFMKRCEWLKKPSVYENEIKALALLVKFYAKETKDPELDTMDKALSQSLLQIKRLPKESNEKELKEIDHAEKKKKAVDAEMKAREAEMRNRALEAERRKRAFEADLKYAQELDATERKLDTDRKRMLENDRTMAQQLDDLEKLHGREIEMQPMAMPTLENQLALKEAMTSVLHYVLLSHPDDLKKDDLITILKNTLDEDLINKNSKKIDEASTQMINFLKNKEERLKHHWFFKAVHAVSDFFRSWVGLSSKQVLKKKVETIMQPPKRPKTR